MKTWVEIDTFTLMQNVRKVRNYIGEGTKLFAVVKANAYGMGLEVVADALWRGGVAGFVVTDLSDALWLSGRNYRLPILILNPLESTVDIAKAVREGLHLAGVNKAYIEQVAQVALREGKQALVHLELETGMHRFGVSVADAKRIMEEAQAATSPLHIVGLFTHLHSVDNGGKTMGQIDAMQQFLFALQQDDVTLPMVHVLSGSAILEAPDALNEGLFDAVRCGRLLYGGASGSIVLPPILTWKTRVVVVKRLRAGESLGYAHTFTTDKDRTIAVVPIGYSDGVDRGLSNNGWVLVQGKRCPILGRVCMNNFMIDVSGVMYPKVGDEVVLIGSQGESEIGSEEVASWIDTIDDEVLTRIPREIPRIKVR